jgi:hypothetical protein
VQRKLSAVDTPIYAKVQLIHDCVTTKPSHVVLRVIVSCASSACRSHRQHPSLVKPCHQSCIYQDYPQSAARRLQWSWFKVLTGNQQEPPAAATCPCWASYQPKSNQVGFQTLKHHKPAAPAVQHPSASGAGRVRDSTCGQLLRENMSGGSTPVALVAAKPQHVRYQCFCMRVIVPDWSVSLHCAFPAGFTTWTVNMAPGGSAASSPAKRLNKGPG